MLKVGWLVNKVNSERIYQAGIEERVGAAACGILGAWLLVDVIRSTASPRFGQAFHSSATAAAVAVLTTVGAFAIGFILVYFALRENIAQSRYHGTVSEAFYKTGSQ